MEGEGSRRQWSVDGSPEFKCVGMWAGGKFRKGTITYLPEGDSYEGSFACEYHTLPWDGTSRGIREYWEHVREGTGTYRDSHGAIVFSGEWADDWPDCEWVLPTPEVARSRTEEQNRICSILAKMTGRFCSYGFT